MDEHAGPSGWTAWLTLDLVWPCSRTLLVIITAAQPRRCLGYTEDPPASSPALGPEPL